MIKKLVKTTTAPPVKKELTKAQASDIGVMQERGRRLLNFVIMVDGPNRLDACLKIQEAIDLTVRDIAIRHGGADGADLV